jgi:hypothetical protein
MCKQQFAMLKKYKLQGTDQILKELIQAGGERLQPEIHNSLILFGVRKNYHVSGRGLFLYQNKVRVIK